MATFPPSTEEFCPVQTEFEEQFRPDRFENTYNIGFWHSRSARYGKPNNMRLLIEGSTEEGQDYLRGLLASSITIFAVAFVWCCLLMVFKCMGPRKFGWLSGRHEPIPAEPDASHYPNGGVNDPEFQKASEERQNKLEKTHKTRKILKWVVVCSGLLIVANAIMLSVMGVDSLIQTLDGIDRVLAVVKNLVSSGIELIDTVISNQRLAVLETEDVLGFVNGICPEIRDPICTNTTDPTSCNFDGIADNGQAIFDFLGIVVNANSLVYEELLKSRDDLVDLLESSNNMGDISETFNWAFWCSMAFSLTLAIICLFFVFAAVRPVSKWNRRIQNCFLVPIFGLMVVLSWVFSMVFVIGSVGLADLCYDSPDENFQAILQTSSGSFSPLIFNAIVFYTSGCPADVPIGQEVVTFMTFLAGTIETILRAKLAFDDVGANLLCDGAAQRQVSAVSQALSTSVCGVTEVLLEFRKLMSCDNWYPLYEESMYNAMCYDGTDGFAWVTSTQIAIVFLSLLIATSRVVYYDIEFEDEDERGAAHVKNMSYADDATSDDLQLQDNGQENNVSSPEVELQDNVELPDSPSIGDSFQENPSSAPAHATPY